MTYRLTAFNTATASANKMHDDGVARSFGFRGGLVPGVDVYAYLCHVPAQQWGAAWLEHGTMHARFASPVYDGDAVAVEYERSGDEIQIELFGPDGTRCATATAALPGDAPLAPDAALWPSGPAPAPAARPHASPETLAAPFGQLEATFHGERAGEYLDDIRERLPAFRSGDVAHPGWLLRYANWVLTANVELGPWIHVESAAQFFGTVHDGDLVETRALLTGVYERKGHRFVDLDVAQVVRGAVVSRTSHIAIYEPRGT